jgi:hypothetical protein
MKRLAPRPFVLEGFLLFTFRAGIRVSDMNKAAIWIKRLGFWGFLFFLVKGLLWLLIPALIALWTTS